MKLNCIKKTAVSVISIPLLLSIFCSAVIVPHAEVYAAGIGNGDNRYELSQSRYNRLLASSLVKNHNIQKQLKTLSNQIDTNNKAIEKIHSGIFKPKTKKDKAEKVAGKFTSGIQALNDQLPGAINLIKDIADGGDFSAASCIKTSVSVVSSIASMCGPWGQLVSAGLNLAETISMMALGGTAESSEVAKLGNEMELQFADLKNELANLETVVKDLSDEISESANRIIEEMPAALEREDDKQQVRQFLLRYEGNFSYNQFRNYLYGDTVANSNASTAYYSLLQEAIVNGESEEVIRRYYDDLYLALTNDIDDFKDYLAPGDGNIKSIVRTYYDYLSSNPDFSSEYGMTPEEAAVQFAYELYQTEQMADSLIMSCNTYQYVQMLLAQVESGSEQLKQYDSYNSSFFVTKARIDAMFSEIETRQNDVSLQIASDMAYIMGISDYYVLEEKDNETYFVNVNKEEQSYNVYSGQKVYLNQMPDVICDLFGFNKYAFSYVVNSQLSDGYFDVGSATSSIVVELRYNNNAIHTTTFFANNDSGFTGGDGSYEDPYLISTAEQFMLIEDGLDKHYLLTRDIDLGGESITPFGFALNSKDGETNEEFTGTLDGNGYTVSNFNIEGRLKTGLFSIVGDNAVVCNLTLEDVSFKAEPPSADSSTNSNYFYIGAFAGENYGKIKNCAFTRSDKNQNKANDISFVLKNETINQNIYVYAGGIAGANYNLVSACFVDNVSIYAESNHSFAGENTKSNKNNVYVGGLIGYNNGLLGYSSVSEKTKVSAKAHSTLSPDDSVNPYVVGLGGGLCGKAENEEDLSTLYSAAATTGVANFTYVNSNWKKYYRNRVQNASNETKCSVPGWSTDKTEKFTCEKDQLLAHLQSKEINYHVAIDGFTSAYSANEAEFDTSKMTVSVTDEVLKDATYKVEDYSVMAVYGFVPFYGRFDIDLAENAVLVLAVTLDNGDSIIAIESVQYSKTRNAVESVEIFQEDKAFIADREYSAIQLSELNGKDNVTYYYLVGSEIRNFDSEKLSNCSIETVNRIKCQKCASFNLSYSVNGSRAEYTCQEKSCKHSGSVELSTYDYLFKGEMGSYIATIRGIYDGSEVIFTFEYEVSCPHTVFEAEYLTPVDVVAPTCILVGYTQYECSECKEIVCKNYLYKTGVHTLETEPETAPTCYEHGYSSAVICSVCGYVEKEGGIIAKLEHDYDEIVYLYDGGKIRLDEYGNKESDQHKCINSEGEVNGKAIYHYENHQYKVSECVLPKADKDGVEEYYLNYIFTCECGHSKSIPDENIIVEENLSLPTVAVSSGYATKGGDEVVVYVQLLNNPGIAGANFGIRYDSRLLLKEFEDGTVLSGSIAKVSNEVNFGYNFVWANADYRTDAGNLLKLVFVVPEDAKLPTQTDIGDVFNISVVYDIENGAQGGFSEIGKTAPQCYVTRDGSITMVNRLPGDVNDDGVVDLLDAVEIGQFLVQKKDSIDEKYANVDLSYNDKGYSNVNVSDMVAILQSMTGGYGVDLLAQEFQVILNGNGFDLGEHDKLFVSLYNDYNNTYSKAGLKELEQMGYKFDGWWTKLVGGEQIISADGQISQVKYFDYQKKQMLYAHWTLNTAILNGNGNTNDIVEPRLSYSEDYKPGAVDTHYEQEYKVIFSDTSTADKQHSIEKTLKFTLMGWALSAESAENGICDYLPDLSDLDLSVANLGELTLYAVWDDGALEYPAWDKQEVGYEPVQWYTNAETTSLLDALDKKASNEIIKSNALKAGDNKTNVYAGFEPIRYTIHFDANGGVGSKLPETNHNVENKNPLSPNNKTIFRVGWTFKGWSLTPDGEVDYADGASVGYIPTPKLQDDGTYAITLYAKWERNPYTVEFYINEPDFVKDSRYTETPYGTMVPLTGCKYEEGVVMPQNQFIIKGCVFKGWAEEPKGEVVYLEGETYKNLAKETSDTPVAKLYAVWEVDPYAVGRYVANNVHVSGTAANSVTYTVYNTIAGTPDSKAGNNTIVDWRKDTQSEYQNIALSFLLGEEGDIYFLGNPQNTYDCLSISITAGDIEKINLHFSDFNFKTYRGIQINSSVEKPLTMEIIGQCSILHSYYGSDSIIAGSKNVSFIGNGRMKFYLYSSSDDSYKIIDAEKISLDNCSVWFELFGEIPSNLVGGTHVFNAWVCDGQILSNTSEYTGYNPDYLNKTISANWLSIYCNLFGDILNSDLSDDLLNIGSSEQVEVRVDGFGPYTYSYATTRESGSTSGSLTGVELSYDQNTRLLTFTKKEHNAEGLAYFKVTDTTTGKSCSITFSWSTTGDGSCFTGDTQVTLADGSSVRLDSLKQGDVVMSWNAITGKFEAMPISMFWNHGDQEGNVISLQFSNGKTVKVVNEHGFFDATLNKYVYIDADNYAEYIGHEFAHMTTDNRFENVVLLSVDVKLEVTSCYSLRTACNDNAIVEGFLTLTHEDIDGFLTYFEFGDDYMYDEEKMQADIEKYGLYSYDDWKDYVSYEEFVALNGQYLKVVIGKGYLTYEDILSLIAGMR